MATRAIRHYELAEIKEAVSGIFQTLSDDTIVGLPVDEILHLLWLGNIHVEKSALKVALNELEDDGIVEQRPDLKNYNNKLFHLKGYGTTLQLRFDLVIPRSEIEKEELSLRDLYSPDEVERQRTSLSVLQDIAAGHAQETTFTKYVRQAAPLLLKENPIGLLLEMAQWAVEDINNLAEITRSANKSKLDEVSRHLRDLQFRHGKITRFFQRLWRLDGDTLYMPTVRQLIDHKTPQKAKLNSVKARAILEKRVLGQTVLEVVSVPQNNHKAAIGSDASVGDVRVHHEQGSFIPPTPAVLFVASAAMRVKNANGMMPYWDYDLDPRELQQFDDLDAAEQGLLISPKLRREAITDFRHLRSAAMELRQYSEELRVVQNRAQWHPISNTPSLSDQPPPVTLLLRDGRIFPLVHRLDDYDGASSPDDILYGKVVRREINTFQNIFLSTAGASDKLSPTYCGTVKSPEFSWLSMIVFWYLRNKMGLNGTLDGFYRPPLNDQVVTHLLFWGLVISNSTLMSDPRNFILTFRAVRRFSDIAFQSSPQRITDQHGNKRAVNEDDEDDWMTYIQQHIQDANTRYNSNLRAIPPLDSVTDYYQFIYLCRHAGATMFYGAPARMYNAVIGSDAHFLLPRWEIATDVSRLTNSTIDYRLKSMLSWLVEDDGLVKDESHAVGGHEDPVEGLPLYIPDVVMQAHEMVVYTQQRHIPDVEDKLQELVSDIREGRFQFA